MKYYTYGYETFKGEKGKITVKANSKDEAWEKLATYQVSHGELHYAWYLSESETGEEKFYEDKKSEQAMLLLIAAFGVALGHTQISQYGDHGGLREAIKKALSDEETQYLMKK